LFQKGFALKESEGENSLDMTLELFLIAGREFSPFDCDSGPPPPATVALTFPIARSKSITNECKNKVAKQQKIREQKENR
jgi:hypothetical protein